MEAEVRNGSFDVAKWAGTFPRRVALALARRQAAIGEVLNGKLLPPLCKIVAAYL
jgi:hypothetical protein